MGSNQAAGGSMGQLHDSLDSSWTTTAYEAVQVRSIPAQTMLSSQAASVYPPNILSGRHKICTTAAGTAKCMLAATGHRSCASIWQG
jgi:hypothetical protein